jgi:hypothetical protein
MSNPPKIDSTKQTVRREKAGGGETPSAPGTGSGAGGGQPNQPELPQHPGKGRPFAEPGLGRTSKQKPARGY